MLRHLQNSKVNFECDFTDNSGNLIDVMMLSWQLLDANEEILAEETVGDVEGESHTITVDEQYHVSSEPVDSRALIVSLMKPSGEIIKKTTYYLIESEATLRVGENSFVTYLQALKVVPSIPNLEGWEQATESEQKAALSYAYINLARLSLIEGAAGKKVTDRHIAFFKKAPQSARDFTDQDWPLMDEQFRETIGLAQILEANYLLGGDEIEAIRQKGVQSYTVGEVKQFFRISKPIDYGVCKEALKHFGKYVNYQTVVVSRA